ncbi:hypothetical protein ES288_D12G305600v1 [Gossypium darwinii]|uniref:DUF4378 domain-containing protein n=1 Tax=Gossypium darwinii TaxID=34276 RepID=A0A5D2AF46_GOSDA|nr:hypothetical protein ES288_D12G305600v1 [Gossypium darwinii]
MGRDWPYWATGAKTSTKRPPPAKAETTTTPTGCISAVFQFFDFHHFQFPLNHQTNSGSNSSSSCGCFKQPHSFISPHSNFVPTALKGTEAPRNSLESEDESSTSVSASVSASLTTSTSKEDESLNIPMGIQIKTSGDIRSKVGASNNDTFSEISGSPGTKTPTLVARLMGLDLLPETHSPSFSQPKSSSSHLKGRRRSVDGGDFRGTRSLPETPRLSSARRSDVDYHLRFSLQINKENMSTTEEVMVTRFSKRSEDENKSPGHYARQIMKQVKESVGRKVGMDITNTVRNREQAREELVNQFKYKKISKAMSKLAEDSTSNGNGKHSTTPSCSPRLRFLEPKTKDQNPQPPKPSEISIQPQPIRVLQKPKLQTVAEEQDDQQTQRSTSKCKKVTKLKKPQRTSDIIRNKQEEPFVRPSTANRANIPDKKCKKTPLSNDLLNITVSSLFPVKKDPSPPATKIPQKQVLDATRPKRSNSSQLSSCSSQTYNNKQEATYLHSSPHDNIGDRCNNVTTTTTGEEAEYHEYIARILRRTGLDKHTPLSLASWFSPSHPINPSIFYYLEHFTTNNNKTSQLNLRCNRKLLFHLVDELLTEILNPFFNMKPWVKFVGRERFSNMVGSQLINTLCSKIGRFPRSDCRVLEDIDALIDKDLPEMKLRCVMAYEEEGEGIVSEIGNSILEALVHETAADFAFCFAGFNFQKSRLLELNGAV